MNQYALISVVIPVYNGERTIAETLESVLNQTYRNLEIIIIDDGSTDDSLNIISQYDDSRIQVFSYPNSGVSKSRNRGITLAQGQYISFIDADDLWTREKLIKQIEVLQNTPSAKVAYSWTDFIDEEGNKIDRDERMTYGGDVYPQILIADFLQSGSNALIYKDALTTVEGFNESLSGPADWDLFIRLAAQYQFVAVSHVGILYRIGQQNSMSSKLSKMEQDSVGVINNSFTQAPAELQFLKNKSLANLYYYLGCKAIESEFTKKQSVLALKYHWRAFKTKYTVFTSKPNITIKIYLKIIMALILPTSVTQKIVMSLRQKNVELKT